MAQLRSYSQADLPRLKVLSVRQVLTIAGEGCPLSLDQSPNLRFMSLWSVSFVPSSTFPNLTHLALSDVYTRECHLETGNLLLRCPNLESLTVDYPHTSQDIAIPPRRHQPLTLDRLQRVTLKLPSFCGPVMEYYISLLPLSTQSTQVPMALQIHHREIEDLSVHFGTLLLHATKATASHLSLAMSHGSERDDILHFVITAAGPQGAFHIASEAFRDEHCAGDWDLLHGSFLNDVLCNGMHLPAVRELWISGKHPHMGNQKHITAKFKSTIAALPALETIVFVVTTTTCTPPEGPNLALCPSVLDAGFASHKLKTLRVVYGNATHRGLVVETLSLRRLLQHVETGVYGYFETLILQMEPWLVVSRVDLQRLRGHFATVKYRHIERMPTMPVPDFCVEPYAGPGGSATWTGSLW